MSEQEILLESQIREIYGRVVYTHKTHEKCADILTKRNNTIKNTQIILAALITTGLLVRVFKGQEWALLISTILSAIQFGLTSFLKEYNLGEIIQKHTSAALELLDLREKYLSLLTDIRAQLISPVDIIIKRDELQDSLSKAYKGLPRTFSKAYIEAQKALQQNEELTFTDNEIDKFLPENLRRT